MDLTPQQRMSIIWLDLPPSPMNTVHDDMLRQLASLGVIEYDPKAATVKFTDLGKYAHWELTGHLPTHNV